MQYTLMVELKAFKPADTNCRMVTDSESSVFITHVWVLFKSVDGGQITIELYNFINLRWLLRKLIVEVKVKLKFCQPL